MPVYARDAGVLTAAAEIEPGTQKVEAVIRVTYAFG